MLTAIRRSFAPFLADEDGLTTVEYALLLVLLVVGGIVVWNTFAGKISAVVDDASCAIT